MRRVLIGVTVLLGLFASNAAHGDTTFSLQGTLQDGTGKFNGTVYYYSKYPDYGQVTGTLTDGSYTFTVPSYLGETLEEGDIFHVDVFSVGLNYDLSLSIPTSLGSTGGSLCALSTPCIESFGSVVSTFSDPNLSGNAIYSQQSFQTLTATPQVTPEPGSFVLLGTGLVAMAATVKRCFRGRLKPTTDL